MPEPVDERLRRLRAAWGRAWPEAAADASRRGAMLDLHVLLHAMTCLAGDIADGDVGRAQVAPDGPGALVADLVRVLFPLRDVRPSALVAASAGAPALRVERSRPGWHLTGAVAAVPWLGDGTELVVCAVDEGDNEVVAVVDVGGRGVRVSGADVALDDVFVPESRLVHAPYARDRLVDQLTVLRLLDVVDVTHEGDDLDPAELALCAAAVRRATSSSASAHVLRRHHDVSSAVALLSARGLAVEDPAVVAWHRQRLLPLV